MSKSGRYTCVTESGVKYLWTGELYRWVGSGKEKEKLKVVVGDRHPQDDHERWIKVNQELDNIIEQARVNGNKISGEIINGVMYRQAFHKIVGHYPIQNKNWAA